MRPTAEELARFASTACLVQVVCGLGTEFAYEIDGRVVRIRLAADEAVEAAYAELNRRVPRGPT